MRNLHRAILPLLLVLHSLVFSPAVHGDDKVLAIVNGEDVTLSDYKRFLLKIDPAMDRERVDMRLLSKAVEEKVIIQEASRTGIKVSDAEVEKSIKEFLEGNRLSEADFEKKITEQGMSTAEYRKWLKENIIVIAKIIEREVGGKVSLDDGEILDYYDKNKDQYSQGPERMQVKAIFLKVGDNVSPAEATYLKIKSMRIFSELGKGAAFDKLAGLYSEDPSKKYDGTFGEFRKGDLVPVLDNKLSGMKEGEISAPLWTKEGVYILQLVKRRGESFIPFGTVKNDIRLLLIQKKRDDRYIEWVKSLWEKSVIEIKSP